MPEMNGFQTTEAIRHLNSAIAQVPIIAVTANVLETEKQQCLLVGMNDFLPKPFSMSELNRCLSQWLNQPD